MGDAKAVGKNVFEVKISEEGKQHFEKFEQTGPIELHDPGAPNMLMPLWLSN